MFLVQKNTRFERKRITRKHSNLEAVHHTVEQ